MKLRNATAPHTRVMLTIVPAISLLLLIGCSDVRTSQVRAAQSATPESAASTTEALPATRDDQDPVSFGWEECSPDATAAFERLTGARAGTPNPAQARKDVASLARECDDAGDLAVCNGLGVVYGEGHGVEPDPAKAIGLFRRACDGGLAMGCFNVALLYRSGIGVPQDLSEATGFFEKACELANVLACQTVAVGYASGRGVPKDLGKAATFYEKACDGGWSPGCTNLAGLYVIGAGVESNPEKAKHFYAKGCKLGSKNACEAANR